MISRPASACRALPPQRRGRAGRRPAEQRPTAVTAAGVGPGWGRPTTTHARLAAVLVCTGQSGIAGGSPGLGQQGGEAFIQPLPQPAPGLAIPPEMPLRSHRGRAAAVVGLRVGDGSAAARRDPRLTMERGQRRVQP